MWVKPLTAAGHYLDLINVMSYDQGPFSFTDTASSAAQVYNPLEAYRAYRAIYKGKINVGFEIPPEGFTAGVTNVVGESTMETIAKGIDKEAGDGLFMWSLQKKATVSTAQFTE